jgi:predicted dehydrogenase/aryl-alcohol dehydrogenase-like predicted oxidoreductase
MIDKELPRLRWGILGAGKIARTFVKALPESESGTPAFVASRDAAKAKKFAGEFGEIASGTYDDLIATDAVDSVYVATPHPQHAEWTIKLLLSGKHVLCEKPLGVNHADAEAMADAARQSGKVLLEAFMYRCHPQMTRLRELIEAGTIGQVQLIDAAFSFRGPDDPSSRLMDPNLAGGGILDVGSYAMSFARFVAGVATGKEFAEPMAIDGQGHLGETGVDEWAVASLEFPGNVVAQLRTGVRLNADNDATIYGTDGKIQVPSPWFAAKPNEPATLQVTAGGETRTIEAVADRSLYALEADAFAACVRDGRPAGVAMSLADTMGNMAALDRWRQAVKLVYPFEKHTGARKETAGGKVLKKAVDAAIPQKALDRVALPISRLVMGVDNNHFFPTNAVLYDAFFEAGGNSFDTATVYGKAKSQVLGEWLNQRGVRDDVNVICKGAHPPHCSPPEVKKQLEMQLDWMQTDRCEIYFLHRDNTDVPVGEWIDAMSECVDAGLIRGIYGGSNWSLPRVKEANEYAKQNGKPAFGGVSLNLSLAVMNDPVWAGCVTAHQDDWLAWLKESGTANFAWSSQARGFFVPERDLEEPELKRCFVDEQNLERRRRCIELAERRGVEPVAVAAAWVLAQDFPSYALIGPRSLAEFRTTLPALSVELSADERAWLDLRDES